MKQYVITYGTRTFDDKVYSHHYYCSTLIEALEWAQEHPDVYIESVAKLLK